MSTEKKKNEKKDTVIKKIWSVMAKGLGQINVHPVPIIAGMAVLIDFINEMLSRRSIGDTFRFIGLHPGMFALNVLMVFATLTIPLLFRKRMTGVLLIGLVWLILGISNYVVLSYRVTPFSAVDIKLFKSVASILHQYMNSVEIALIVAAVLLIIVGAVVLWFRAPKLEGTFRRWPYLLLMLAAFGSAYGFNALGKDMKKIPTDLGNISFVYDACGYNYCFVSSVFDVGIQKPKGYSEETMNTIREGVGRRNISHITTKPNIIIVQLESVYNVNNMKNYTFSENPIPNLTELSQNYSSGYVTVPSIGAGTANTEFETISGMSLDYFGFCEYPYKTALKRETCESICYDLDELNYVSTAIHNNRANFYSRNRVFKKLGFDRFDSVEYMNDLEYNQLDWPDDSVLTGEILKAMETTPTSDFIYTITVASHGAYPAEGVDGTPQITMTGEPDEIRANKFTYYANAIHDTDEFVGELIAALEQQDEPCVVFFFGDHLPTLDITDDELEGQNTFQTSYVMWDNIGLEKQDRDLYSFQTTAYIMERLGYNTGILTRYHQKYSDSPDYEKGLELLEYDMLYGNRYIYGQVNPYDETNMEMGLEPITIHDVRASGDILYVSGENFTDASYIYVNGDKKETEMWNENFLIAKNVEVEAGDRICVRQLAAGKSKISKTEEYIYEGPPTIPYEEDTKD